MNIFLWLKDRFETCDAGRENAFGQSLMDNPLAVYRCLPYLSGMKRCGRRAVAGLKVYHGMYRASICAEHNETIWHGKLNMRIDVNNDTEDRYARPNGS